MLAADRRSFLKRMFYLGGATFLAGMYAWQLEPFWLEYVRVNMRVKNLPDHLKGKKLFQFSDLHVGNRFDWQLLIDSFQEAQEMKPDIVVYTGDFVSYENEEQFTQLETVIAHAVKGALGTYAVLGNHDYGLQWAENDVADRIVAILEKNGIVVLRNESRNCNGLFINGVDDFWGTNFHPEKVMEHVDHTKANIVLCHNPDAVDQDVWFGYKGWILSGHTHGGQVKPPFLPPPMLPVKNKNYSAGEIPLADGRTLYINRALGHLWQVRFNVRPEITVFNLDTHE